MSSTPAPEAPWPAELPLFPLQLVLFPGAVLGLRVFEARYLDLIGNCLRSGTPFAVVRILQGGELRGIAHPHPTAARFQLRTSTATASSNKASNSAGVGDSIS